MATPRVCQMLAAVASWGRGRLAVLLRGYRAPLAHRARRAGGSRRERGAGLPRPLPAATARTGRATWPHSRGQAPLPPTWMPRRRPADRANGRRCASYYWSHGSARCNGAAATWSAPYSRARRTQHGVYSLAASMSARLAAARAPPLSPPVPLRRPARAGTGARRLAITPGRTPRARRARPRSRSARRRPPGPGQLYRAGARCEW